MRANSATRGQAGQSRLQLLTFTLVGLVAIVVAVLVYYRPASDLLNREPKAAPPVTSAADRSTIRNAVDGQPWSVKWRHGVRGSSVPASHFVVCLLDRAFGQECTWPGGSGTVPAPLHAWTSDAAAVPATAVGAGSGFDSAAFDFEFSVPGSVPELLDPAVELAWNVGACTGNVNSRCTFGTRRPFSAYNLIACNISSSPFGNTIPITFQVDSTGPADAPSFDVDYSIWEIELVVVDPSVEHVTHAARTDVASFSAEPARPVVLDDGELSTVGQVMNQGLQGRVAGIVIPPPGGVVQFGRQTDSDGLMSDRALPEGQCREIPVDAPVSIPGFDRSRGFAVLMEVDPEARIHESDETDNRRFSVEIHTHRET